MINHGEKCRLCNGHMSEPKLVNEGPKKGQTRTICSKCGHIIYLQGPAQANVPQQERP